ncbi:MAG: Fe-S cluster assembly protein SufD [Pelosinus sp.]|nr:Fe-S cluster assembly protein SufD [Pelosinus sp.]
MESIDKLNAIPVRTWKWLGVNETRLAGRIPEKIKYDRQPLIEGNTAGYMVAPIAAHSDQIRFMTKKFAGGVSQAADEFISSQRNSGYFIEISEDAKLTKPLTLYYELDAKNPSLVDDHFIFARENSEATVVIYYSASDFPAGFHGGMTRVYAQKGAVVHVVKVQLLHDAAMQLDAVDAAIEEEAHVEFTLVELGAAESITSAKVCLNGKNSSGQINSLYFGNQQQKIDMNYELKHVAPGARGLIESRGVLLGKSQKTFRGTLDFLKGAKGAKGRESEFTVLLSPEVRNRSIPLMLCGEDDVEGQHAASSGKIDEEQLFYLMSRGLSEVEAKKLIIEAAFAPIVAKIPVAAIKDAISENIRRRLADV